MGGSLVKVRGAVWGRIGLLVLLLFAQSLAQEWRHHGGDAASTRFSRLQQINRENVGELEVLWRWESSDFVLAQAHGVSSGKLNQSTPLMVEGVLYFHSPLNQVFAIDPSNGEQIWSFDSEAWRDYGAGTPNARGLAYAEVEGKGRLFLGTADDRLIALETSSGQPVEEFGRKGEVDLSQGLRRPFLAEHYAVRSPPIVCNGVVIVGSSIRDGVSEWDTQGVALPPPGDVRGFDARTGEHLWTFHTIPMKGEHGYQSWSPGTAERTGAANVWTMMSADQDLGYVYLPVSTLSSDFYGGGRAGDNLFGDSLVCLEARTGRRVWHYQLVHHGVWDYDPPAAPILADVVVEGEPRKVVVQNTKQAFSFVFDRLTGEPIWPILERPVPQSEVTGERTSSTQPFPTKPLPFDRQGLASEDVVDFTPELKEQTLEFLEQFEFGPLYTPPSEKGTIQLPGMLGGADLAGAALNPDTGVLYVPSRTQAGLARLERAPKGHPYPFHAAPVYGVYGPDGLPLTKPPYGRLTAIDLNSGDHLWSRAVGRGPRDHPLLRDLDLEDLGWDRRAFVLATGEFILAALQSATGEPQHDEPFLYAYDTQSGERLARIELPENVEGAFMTYMQGGRQYFVLPVGGETKSAGLLALGLPTVSSKGWLMEPASQSVDSP